MEYANRGPGQLRVKSKHSKKAIILSLRAMKVRCSIRDNFLKVVLMQLEALSELARNCPE